MIKNTTWKADVVIVGTGAGGLFCALSLPKSCNILMITKSDLYSSDSYLAQGGICVLKDKEDYESFYNDTMKAGHYKNNPESVDIMIRSSKDVINDLERFGVNFEKGSEGYKYTREAAHSESRILYYQDITGKEITSKLMEEAKKRSNITIYEYTTMVDIMKKDDRCKGILAVDKDGTVVSIFAEQTVFATGGIGGLFPHSTNFPHLTGDAIGIALKNDIKVKDLDYIQIHPTSLYSKKKGRRFLISESVRGEGAILLNKAGERFTDELLPRDVLSAAIHKQMEEDQLPYVMLSMEGLGDDLIRSRFPNILKQCQEEGYDVTKECIPVVPSQHYFMGGIEIDKDSRTSMNGLYAIGETSCNGVHGANRLASNSLLETIVYAKRAARSIELESANWNLEANRPEANRLKAGGIFDENKNLQNWLAAYGELVRNEIERMKKNRE